MGLKDKVKEIEALKGEVKEIEERSPKISKKETESLRMVNDLKSEIKRREEEIKDKKTLLRSLVKENDFVLNEGSDKYEFKTDFKLEDIVEFLYKEFGYSKKLEFSSRSQEDGEEYDKGNPIVTDLFLCYVGVMSYKERCVKEKHLKKIEETFGSISFEQTVDYSDDRDSSDYCNEWRVFFDGQPKITVFEQNMKWSFGNYVYKIGVSSYG